MNNNATTPDKLEKEVSFSHSCQGARSVCVAIFFKEIMPPMVRTLQRLRETKPGYWCGDITLSPGWCEYLLLVDGEWVPDLNAAQQCPDGIGDFISACWVGPLVQPDIIRLRPPLIAARRHRGAARRSAA